MKKRAAVLIIDKDKILLIHRIKNGIEYYVIPGGNIEEGESPEKTAIREAKEETNLDIELGELFYEVKNKAFHGFYFLVKSFKGEQRIIGEELDRMSEDNQYHLEWHKLKEIKNIPLVPKDIKRKLIAKFS